VATSVFERIKIVLIVPFIWFALNSSWAQISCTNAVGRDTTIYSNGLSNDSLFFFCASDSIKLRYFADPNSMLEWYRFSIPTNNWTLLGNAASFYNTMQAGGYRVVERDTAGLFLNESVAWTCRLPAANPVNPSLYMDVNLNNISPGCGSVTLNWISSFVGLGNISSYYDKPKTQITETRAFDSTSTIEVCMDIYHAYLNDLQLYLIGPESCGRPIITLVEGITSTDSICPQVVADPQTLCFSNEVNNPFNYCQFSASPEVYYSSYGWNNVPITWDSLNGCDMNENDWHVQASDCFGEFIGAISQASISFTADVNGVESTAEYVLSSPSAVIINNCESDTTNLPPFNRYLPVAAARGHAEQLQLSSNPPIPGLSDVIPSSGFNGGSYTIPASQVTQNTYFYVEIIRPRLNANDCGQPILTFDSSFYDYIEPDTADISGNLFEYCVNGAPDTLESGSGNGFWTGPGMDADSSSGVFFPNLAGLGNHSIIFRRYTGCKTGDTIVVSVDALNTLNVSAPGVICDSLDMFSLAATVGGPNVDQSLGIWSGNALVNDSLGWVNPLEMNDGPNEYVFSYNDGCIQQASLVVTAEPYVPIELSLPDSAFCSTAELVPFSSNVSGIWSGPGISGDGSFNPGQSQEGNISIVFNPQSVCYSNITVPLTVVNPLPLSLTLDNSICDTIDAISVIANYPNGTWVGANGVTPQAAVFPVEVDMSGIYPVSYVIQGVCIDSISAIVDVEDFVPLTTSLNDTLLCVVSDTIALSSNFNGDWMGASSASDILVPGELGAGVHEVAFHPFSSCHLPVNYSIDIRDPIAISLFYDSLICNTQDSLFLSALPSIGSWSSNLNLLQISDGQAAADINPAYSGSYEFFYDLSDVCQSRDTASVYVETYSPLNLPFEDTAVCSTSDTLLFESNYSGIWSGPGIINSEGSFFAGATDLSQLEIIFIPSSACHGVALSSVTVVQPPDLEMDIPSVICSNTDSVFPSYNIVGGQWLAGFPVHPESGGIFPPDVPAGYYELSYTLSGVCTVVAVDTFELIEYLPVVAEGVPHQLCASLDSVFLYTNQLGQWTGEGFISDSGWYSPVLLDTGNYVFSFNPTSPCVSDTTFEVDLVPFTEVTINLPASVCLTDEPFELLASPSTGTWSGPGVDNVTGIFHPSAAGASEFSIAYSLDDVCNTLVGHSIIVVDTVSLALTSQEEILCPGEQALITSNLDNLTFVSSHTSLIGNDVYFVSDGLAAGAYSIIAEYAGVCYSTDEIFIQVFDTTLNILPIGPLCMDAGAIELHSNINSGSWSGPGVLGYIFHPEMAGVGSHMVHLQVDSVCSYSDSVMIQVESYPQVIHSLPAAWCDNAGAIDLQILPVGGVWSVSVPQNGAINPENLSGEIIDINYVLDTVCDVNFEWQITIEASPQIAVSSDTIICPGAAASLSASGADDYSWSPSDFLSNPSSENPGASPLVATSYEVIGANAVNCFDTSQVFVDLFPQPMVEIIAEDSACFGEAIQLNATGGSTYEWIGEGISEYNISNPVLLSEQSQEIFVTGTDINGCSASDSIDITIIHPVASVTPASISGVSPFEVTFINQSEADTFHWDFGNGEVYYSENSNDNPTIIFEGETNYTVMLVGTTAFCKDTSFAQVEVIYDSKILLFPNIVTNNGDGKNDMFRLLTQNISELDLVIRNRWGDFIASIETPDGYWSARESNDGTYYYTYTAVGMDGRTFSGNGYFTVLSDD